MKKIPNSKTHRAVRMLFALLMVSTLLSGCASQYVLSERVNTHSLGEIKVTYSDVVFKDLSKEERQRFEEKIKREMKDTVAPRMNGDQPLHVYVNIKNVSMVSKTAQVLSAVFFSFNDIADVFVVYVFGEPGVAAPKDIKAAVKKIAEYAEGEGGKEGLRYVKFRANAGDGLFSTRGKRIDGLAEIVVGIASKVITHDRK